MLNLAKKDKSVKFTEDPNKKSKVVKRSKKHPRKKLITYSKCTLSLESDSLNEEFANVMRQQSRGQAFAIMIVVSIIGLVIYFAGLSMKGPKNSSLFKQLGAYYTTVGVVSSILIHGSKYRPRLFDYVTIVATVVLALIFLSISLTK